MTIVTVKDVRAAGYCAQGARRWFESHDFDFAEFLRVGIAEERLRATGDAMALRVIQTMRERADGRR